MTRVSAADHEDDSRFLIMWRGRAPRRSSHCARRVACPSALHIHHTRQHTSHQALVRQYSVLSTQSRSMSESRVRAVHTPDQKLRADTTPLGMPHCTGRRGINSMCRCCDVVGVGVLVRNWTCRSHATTYVSRRSRGWGWGGLYGRAYVSCEARAKICTTRMNRRPTRTCQQYTCVGDTVDTGPCPTAQGAAIVLIQQGAGCRGPGCT